jgi:spermidine synthase
MKADLWITEQQTEDMLISFRIKEKLHEEKTDFQHLSVVDTYTYGRMLFLDHCVMTSIKEEFVYHEMITLVALNTHPNPEHVLVIGGGDIDFIIFASLRSRFFAFSTVLHKL